MKNIFYILLLLPTIIFAQYPSNSGQKITLGEQTTADGLVWRGVAADTTLTAKSDTAAYFVLDTVNINLYTYKASATGRKWRQLGADTASIAYVNTYGTQTIGGAKTFTSAVTGARFNPTSSSAAGTGMFLPSANTLGFSTDGVERLNISSTGQFILKGGTNAILRGGRFINDSLEFRMLSSESASVSKFLSFYTSNSSVNTEKLRITSDGNIGIGTTSPFAQLSINGDYTSIGLQPFEMTRTAVLRDSARFSIRNSTNNTGEFLPTFEGISNFLSSSLAVGMIFIGRPQEDNSSDDVAIRFDGRRKISGSLITGAISEFANLGTIVMRIMGSGNVGIGQSTPTAVLHLKAGTATASTAPLKFTSGVALTTPEVGAMEFSNISGTNRLLISPADNVRKEIAYTDFTNASGVLPVANGGTGENMSSLPNNYLIRKNSSGIFDTAAIFESGGNVGIGTNAPTNNLSILGSGIAATRLLIDGNGCQGTTPSGCITDLVLRRTTGRGFAFQILSDSLTDTNFNVESTVSGANQMRLRTDSNLSGMNFINGSSTAPIRFIQDLTPRLIINSGGEILIGYQSNQDNGAYRLQVNSQIFATNATIATSDIKFKENIQPLDKGLEIINKLKPVKFNFITTTENNFSEFDEIGFIAQDVEGALSTELFAKAVVKKLDENKDDSALGLMTEKFIPILVKAIQEQQALIKALEQRIINLENK